MTLQERLSLFITAVGTDVKNILSKIGNLNSLQTTNKSSLVEAINEVKSSGGGVQINDVLPSGTTTYSSNKIEEVATAAASAAKNEILGGASAAFDTLQEIEAALGNDDTAIANLLTAVSNRVSYSQADVKTAPEQAQARANINALGAVELGNPDTDLVALYSTAKA